MQQPGMHGDRHHLGHAILTPTPTPMGTDLARIAGRLAAILDALTDEPVSVRKLANEVGIPRSTAFDYLVALESNGRAERTPRGWTQPSTEFLFGGRPVNPDDPEVRGEPWAA